MNSVKCPCSPWILVAQWTERLPGAQKVMGSIPVGDLDPFFIPCSCHVDQFTFHNMWPPLTQTVHLVPVKMEFILYVYLFLFNATTSVTKTLSRACPFGVHVTITNAKRALTRHGIKDNVVNATNQLKQALYRSKHVLVLSFSLHHVLQFCRTDLSSAVQLQWICVCNPGREHSTPVK